MFYYTLVPKVVVIINLDLSNKSNCDPLNITCKLKNNIKFLKTFFLKKKKKKKKKFPKNFYLKKKKKVP